MTTTTGGADTFAYIGNELELFADAVTWKRYWGGQVRPYLGTRIADVGAGIGNNVGLLGERGQDWTCAEPDAALAARISDRVRSGEFPFGCRVVVGGCSGLDAGAFDSLLYIDVLEHIEDDRAEIANAAQRLRVGGHLVSLSPAHPFLFSAFDSAIGHHRRYTRSSLLSLTPPALRPVRVRYLDSVGMLASLANAVLLREARPTAAQIHFWDRMMVPCSRVIDPMLGYRLGKSLLCVWQRT